MYTPCPYIRLLGMDIYKMEYRWNDKNIKREEEIDAGTHREEGHMDETK